MTAADSPAEATPGGVTAAERAGSEEAHTGQQTEAEEEPKEVVEAEVVLLATVQTAVARSVGAVAGAAMGVRSEEAVAAVASQQVRTGGYAEGVVMVEEASVEAGGGEAAVEVAGQAVVVTEAAEGEEVATGAAATVAEARLVEEAG